MLAVTPCPDSRKRPRRSAENFLPTPPAGRRAAGGLPRRGRRTQFSPTLALTNFPPSGRRESNPVLTHPKRVYCRCTTPRLFIWMKPTERQNTNTGKGNLKSPFRTYKTTFSIILIFASLRSGSRKTTTTSNCQLWDIFRSSKYVCIVRANLRNFMG